MEGPAPGGCFGGLWQRNKSDAAVPMVDVKTLHAKIVELALENDILAGALNKAGLLSARK